MKYPYHPEHPEHNDTVKEEEREYCEQVDDTFERDHEPQHGTRLASSRIQQIRSPDTKQIFYAENYNSYKFGNIKNYSERSEFLESIEEGDKNIDDDDCRDEYIKPPAHPVIFVAYLYDIKYSFSAHNNILSVSKIIGIIPSFTA